VSLAGELLMSQLDYHVTKVQGKMLTTAILHALAWSLLVYGGIVWLVILVSRLFSLQLPRPAIWFWAGLGVSIAAAFGYAIWRRPGRDRAAVAIDERLGLKEKFSTALYFRKHSASDPFAAAAVRDAETTAERVHLQDKFPIAFPRTGAFTLGVGLVAFLTGWLLEPMDLLGRKAQAAKIADQERKETVVKQEIKKAIAKIESAPLAVQKDEKVQAAAGELKKMLARPMNDPTSSSRMAQNALDELKAKTQKIKELQNTAQALNDMKAWKDLAGKPIDESGPVGKAQSALAKGEFSKAVDLLKETVDKFDKMDKKDQDKAAEQMKQMAQQMQQMANDPQKQQAMQKQLQQMGANQQQAQQMVQKMQQAASGDKQAQQQMQQMANQMMQQMNNGQGPSQQQMQQVQSMLQQMQQQANGQAQAQQLAQNAQQLAQAMQQAAQQQGQPGNQGQQQQGNQSGQQAQQQMQQQMQQMQAMADAAAQQGGNPGAPQDGTSPQSGQGESAGEQADSGQGKSGDGAGGQSGEGNPGNRGGNAPNAAGGGQANGERPKPQEAPFAVKTEVSKSQTIEKGKILAANYVKASALPGESKAKLREIIKAMESEATDEVDQTRVSRQAREAVKEYHRSLQEESPAAPAAVK
jgi:hypothetical protein